MFHYNAQDIHVYILTVSTKDLVDIQYEMCLSDGCNRENNVTYPPTCTVTNTK